jgi:hydroxyacylglutathione hydrolase
MIICTLPVGGLQANCYVVGCEKSREGIIIDPGAESGKILSIAEEHGLTIKAILLTHAHFDHSVEVNFLKEKTRAEFCMHRDDLFLLEETAAQAAFFGFKVEAIVPEVDRFIEEGDEIPFGELRAAVLHTPGHSPGGVSFLIGDAVFVGDTLFAGSVGRSDFTGGSHERLIRSIKSKLLTLDPETRVFPGHGPQTTIRAEKQSNPFLQ